MKTRFSFFKLSVCALALCCSPLYAEEPPRANDSYALAGVEVGKVAFDITPGDPKKLLLFLKVIAQTHADLIRQAVTPDMILVFHGAAVKLLSTQHAEGLALDEEEAIKNIAELLADLKQKGVRIEACSIATNLFNVPNDSLLPGIELVGNTFVSQIGYQAKGYAIIPIN
jgi:intracellular sulfur oxidation DsrE/DsrF family protein